MKTKDYLFAVSAIRANEASLLRESDLEQLINAPDYKKAISMLTEKGFEAPQGNDFSEMLDKQLDSVWQLVKKSAPEAECLDMLVVKNDFQNLKAILKAQVTGNDAKKYFAYPCVFSPEEMLEIISERRFDDLPEFIRDVAKEAFDIITKTGNGQLCDIFADSATLKAVLEYAKLGNDATLTQYAERLCIAANLKTAYRCIKTEKNEAFIKTALCECESIKTDELTAAVLSGEEAFGEYLDAKGLSKYKQALENGTSAFEKHCDDMLMSAMKQARMTVFGVSPLAGYYVAKETEVKCLRIILSAKLSEVSNDVIRERMRELYV